MSFEQNHPLSSRTALVTGGAVNLGRGIATELARSGATVVLHARTRRAAANAASEVADETGGSVIPIAFDLSSADQIEGGFAELDAKGVLVDGLVLNAAHQGLHEQPTLSQPHDFFDEVVRVNLFGVHRCALHTAHRLVSARKPGSIVAISSLAGERSVHGRLAYNTSKAAVDGFVRSLALELAPYSIRVNSIAPGFVWSDRWESLDSTEASRRRALIPLGAEATISELSRLATFLIGDAVPAMTGQRVVVDGGVAAQQSPPPTVPPFNSGCQSN